MACVRADLESIFSSNRVFDDEKTLRAYSCDQSFVPARTPDFVVYAESAAEVQQLLSLANQTLTPIVPYSSGLNFHGATIHDHGGIILNLSRMDRILRFDEENWFVIIEPGVTYEQF